MIRHAVDDIGVAFFRERRTLATPIVSLSDDSSLKLVSSPPSKSVCVWESASRLLVRGTDSTPWRTARERLVLDHAHDIGEALHRFQHAHPTCQLMIVADPERPDVWACWQSIANERALPLHPLRRGRGSLAYPWDHEAMLQREFGSEACCVDIEEFVDIKPEHVLLTVAGHSLTAPGHYWVPLGMRASSVIEKVGGTRDGGVGIWDNPLSGDVISDWSSPVTLNRRALFFFRTEELGDSHDMVCIRCARCHMICPLHLHPYRWPSHTNEVARTDEEILCLRCGLCDYVCPSHCSLSLSLGERS